MEKLSAGGGFYFALLSEFEWKITAVESPDDGQTTQDQTKQDQTTQDHQSPHILGQLNLEITLTKRLPPFARKRHEKNPLMNAGLTDDAFQPKSFTVRIEQGNFSTPGRLLLNDRLLKETGHVSTDIDSTWTKRLVFNKSPYPPESEWKEDWKEDWKLPDGENYWDFKEFVTDH